MWDQADNRWDIPSVTTADAVDGNVAASEIWVCAICGQTRVNPYGAPAGDRPQACGACGDLLAILAVPAQPHPIALAAMF